MCEKECITCVFYNPTKPVEGECEKHNKYVTYMDCCESHKEKFDKIYEQRVYEDPYFSLDSPSHNSSYEDDEFAVF